MQTMQLVLAAVVGLQQPAAPAASPLLPPAALTLRTLAGLEGLQAGA